MNDLEYTDLQNALDRANHILSTNEFDEEAEKVQEIQEAVKKEIYG